MQKLFLFFRMTGRLIGQRILVNIRFSIFVSIFSMTFSPIFRTKYFNFHLCDIKCRPFLQNLNDPFTAIIYLAYGPHASYPYECCNANDMSVNWRL